MYVTAAAIWLGRQASPQANLLDFLTVSRWVSILMTVAAIWGTFWLGRQLFSSGTGLLAAGLFTFSPYVLHFGKDALTQGDAFASALVVFMLLAFVRFSRTRFLFWHFVFSALLGLAIASKFFLVILIPPLLIYFFMVEKNRGDEAGSKTDIANTKESAETRKRIYLGVSVAAGFATLLAVLLSLSRLLVTGAISQAINVVARGFWLVALLSLLIVLVLAIREYRIQKKSLVPGGLPWPQWHIWVSAISIAFAVVMALFPSHIFNKFILLTLFERVGFVSGGAGLFAETLSSLRLYLGVVLLKLGLPLGVTTLIALVWGGIKGHRNNSFLLITLVLLFYIALLAVLPLQQPFWLMSVYPLILLVLSEMIRQVFQRITRPGPRLLFGGWVVFACGWLIVGLFQVYPNFGYYGYETIGDQWLGAGSKGYRAVVVVTNDGTTAAIDWLQQNTPPGSTVLSYLTDIHLLNYLDQTRKLNFNLVHAAQGTDDDNARIIQEGADYVVLRPLEDVGGPFPLDNPAFIESFGSDPVFTLIRGRGPYQIPVILIYERENT
jgi:hypothetical protein